MKGTMNDLEKVIIAGVKKAQKKYEYMADQWLDAAPEAFWQILVGVHISEEKNLWVEFEQTEGKMKKTAGVGVVGRPPKNNRQMFDVIVWRSENKVAAVIEIKRGRAVEPIVNDIKKLRNLLKQKFMRGATGYVLVYTIWKRGYVSTIFEKAAREGRCKLFKPVIGPTRPSQSGWRWGVGLIKIDAKRR